MYRINPFVILVRVCQHDALVNCQTGSVMLLNDSAAQLVRAVMRKKNWSADEVAKLQDKPWGSTFLAMWRNGLLVADAPVDDEISCGPPPEAILPGFRKRVSGQVSFMGVMVELLSDNDAAIELLSKLYPADWRNAAGSICCTVKLSSLQPVPIWDNWHRSEVLGDLRLLSGRHSAAMVSNAFIWHWPNDYRWVHAWEREPEVAAERLRCTLDLLLERGLAARGAVCVHAAAVELKNGPILLVGESGSGKTSVLQALLRSGKTAALADDRVFLDPVNKSVMGYLPGMAVYGEHCVGVPLDLGSERRTFIAANALPAVRVGAFLPVRIVRLQRASRTAFRKLSEHESCQLLASMSLLPPQAALRGPMTVGEVAARFQVVDRILQQIPMYELLCDSADAAAGVLLQGGVPGMSVRQAGSELPRRDELGGHGVVRPSVGASSVTLSVSGYDIRLWGCSADCVAALLGEFSCAEGDQDTAYDLIVCPHLDEVPEMDATQLWRSSRLALSMWDGTKRREFRFDDGRRIIHHKDAKLTTVVSDGLDGEYPLLRAAVGQVVQRLAVADGWLPCHAALLSHEDGNGIMLIGPKGAGKTSCCMWMQEAGLGVSSDELAMLRTDGDRLLAYGLARGMSVCEDIMGPNALGDSVSSPFSWGTKRVIPSQRPLHISPQSACVVRRIFCPIVVPWGEPHLRQMTCAESQLALLKASVRDAGEVDKAAAQALAFRVARDFEIDILSLTPDHASCLQFVKRLAKESLR